MPSCDPIRIPASLQALSPAQAGFCLAVSRFLSRELQADIRGRHLLIAFSGGADSTALLLALHYLTPSLAISLTAAHLDHGLRSSSAREAEYCRDFCRKLGLDCISERRNVREERKKGKRGEEEQSRISRYEFLASTAARLGCDWIATAHNANDLAEDLLMRLLRGTGWPALSGMAALDPGRRLLRPLLLTPRTAIEAFLRSLELAWLTDESNTDPAFLRNRVRASILPLFLNENPAFLESVIRLWRLGRIDEAWFNELLPPAPQRVNPPLVLEAAQLAVLPKALRLRLYKKTLSLLGPGQALLDNLLALDRAWLKGTGRTVHHFPGNKKAMVSSKGIIWEHASDGQRERP